MFSYVRAILDESTTALAGARRPQISGSSALVLSAVATGSTLVAGPGATAGPVVVALVVAYAAFAAAFVARRRPSRRLVIGLAVGLGLLAVVRPPTGSHDVWSYAMYGRIVAHYGRSPYLHAPRQFLGDPLLHRVDPLWVGTRSVYGPLFTWWSATIARVAGGSSVLLRLGFQLSAAAAVGACGVLLDRRTKGDARALAFLLLNPLVVCSLVNDGHIDALVGVAVLGAVLLVERKREAAAGATVGVAVLIKAIAILPAGALGLWLVCGRRLRPVVHFGVALLLVVGAGYAVGGGRAAIRPLTGSSDHLTWSSVWGPSRHTLTNARVERGATPAAARRSVGALLGLLASLAVVAATVGLVLATGSRAGPALVAVGAVLAYMLLGAYVLPWYAGAALATSALVQRWPPTWIFVAHAALLQLGEVPGRRFLHPLPHGASTASWHRVFQRSVLPPVELLLVLAVALTARRGVDREDFHP